MQIEAVATAFKRFPGQFGPGVRDGHDRLGNGHIHQTVAARWRDSEGGNRTTAFAPSCLQRAQYGSLHRIPEALMENIAAGGPTIRRRLCVMVPELLRNRWKA